MTRRTTITAAICAALAGAALLLSVASPRASAELHRLSGPTQAAPSQGETIEEIVARHLARDRAARERMAPTLAAAERIAREVDRRYQRTGADLLVPEVALTPAIATLELAADHLRAARSVPADDGIYFAICRRQPCAWHRQAVSRKLALIARRQALELALRTLQETQAGLVVVALPRRWLQHIWVVLERRDLLANDTAGRALRRMLRQRRVSAGPHADEVARRHLYVLGPLIPYSETQDSIVLFALPLQLEEVSS